MPASPWQCIISSPACKISQSTIGAQHRVPPPLSEHKDPHLLRDLAIELGGGVGEVRLDVDQLLQLLKLPVHLQDRDILAVVGVWPIEELDA